MTGSLLKPSWRYNYDFTWQMLLSTSAWSGGKKILQKLVQQKHSLKPHLLTKWSVYPMNQLGKTVTDFKGELIIFFSHLYWDPEKRVLCGCQCDTHMKDILLNIKSCHVKQVSVTFDLLLSWIMPVYWFLWCRSNVWTWYISFTVL